MARRRRAANQWARGLSDLRGPSGRAQAIRAGVNPDHLADVLAAGDPRRGQLTLDLGSPGRR